MTGEPLPHWSDRGARRRPAMNRRPAITITPPKITSCIPRASAEAPAHAYAAQGMSEPAKDAMNT